MILEIPIIPWKCYQKPSRDQDQLATLKSRSSQVPTGIFMSVRLNISWKTKCLDLRMLEPDHATAAPVDGVLWGDDPNVDGSLLPLPVVSRHVLNLVEILAELVDVVKETNRVIL